jgi:carbon storage regulator
MLVLSRKRSETVLVPQLNLEVVVLNIQNGKVKLGFRAPPDVQIVRGELMAETVEIPVGTAH